MEWSYSVSSSPFFHPFSLLQSGMALLSLISLLLIVPLATAKDKPPIDRGVSYTIVDVNTASDASCAYVGYTEIEIQLNKPSERYLQTITVHAIRNQQPYEVAVIEQQSGVYNYPVEFFASECTERLELTFTQ